MVAHDEKAGTAAETGGTDEGQAPHDLLRMWLSGIAGEKQSSDSPTDQGPDTPTGQAAQPTASAEGTAPEETAPGPDLSEDTQSWPAPVADETPSASGESPTEPTSGSAVHWSSLGGASTAGDVLAHADAEPGTPTETTVDATPPDEPERSAAPLDQVSEDYDRAWDEGEWNEAPEPAPAVPAPPANTTVESEEAQAPAPRADHEPDNDAGEDTDQTAGSGTDEAVAGAAAVAVGDHAAGPEGGHRDWSDENGMRWWSEDGGYIWYAEDGQIWDAENGKVLREATGTPGTTQPASAAEQSDGTADSGGPTPAQEQPSRATASSEELASDAPERAMSPDATQASAPEGEGGHPGAAGVGAAGLAGAGLAGAGLAGAGLAARAAAYGHHPQFPDEDEAPQDESTPPAATAPKSTEQVSAQEPAPIPDERQSQSSAAEPGTQLESSAPEPRSRRRGKREPQPKSRKERRGGGSASPSVEREIPEHLEFHPRAIYRTALRVVLGLAVLAAIGSVIWAATGRNQAAIGIAAGVTGVALACWWGLLSWTPTTVAFHQQKLEVSRGTEGERFDLLDPTLDIEVGDDPRSKSWRTTIVRPNNSVLIIPASSVDPEQFSRIVHHYRAQVGDRRSQ